MTHSEDEEKLVRFYNTLSDIQIIDFETDDAINLQQWFLILRDIFGINTFEIEKAPNMPEVVLVEDQHDAFA